MAIRGIQPVECDDDHLTGHAKRDGRIVALAMDRDRVDLLARYRSTGDVPHGRAAPAGLSDVAQSGHVHRRDRVRVHHRARHPAQCVRVGSEAQRLRAQLEEYRKLAENGDIDAPEYAPFSKSLKARIAEARPGLTR